MIKTFVLIVILNKYGAGTSTLSVEFNNESACTTAKYEIMKDIGNSLVESIGCYPKE